MAESMDITAFKPVMPLATPEEARKGWSAFIRGAIREKIRKEEGVQHSVPSNTA